MPLTEVSAFKNLSIVNDDINGSAAIAGSKISPSFTSNVTITNAAPKIDFVDDNSDSDFRLQNFNGSLVIHDISENLTRFALSSDGTATFYHNLNANSGLDVTGGDITGVLGSAVTATTQSAGDNSTKIATTAYVDGASVSTEQVQDIVGGMVSTNTETNIEVTYDDANGKLNFASTGTNIGIGRGPSAVSVSSSTGTSQQIPAASTTQAGVMTGTDKTNLDGLTSSSGVLKDGVTATTQSANDNSTKVATTAYVDNASGIALTDLSVTTTSASGGGSLSYDNSTGVFTFAPSTNSGGGGSASSLTSPDGTTKVEATNDEVKVFDILKIQDGSLPMLSFRNTAGDTQYGFVRFSSVGAEINSQAVTNGAGRDFKIKHKGTSEYTKILFRDGISSNTGTSDVCIGRALQGTGKPSGLNAFFPFLGGVELYHIASGGTSTKKFETTANGITVQGSVTTEDINMSNLNASANEVDNTKGSWTIQEGASDLFLINRVNGKKYKFNLTEIS